MNELDILKAEKALREKRFETESSKNNPETNRKAPDGSEPIRLLIARHR